MNEVFDAVDFGLVLIDGQLRVQHVNRWVAERARARCPQPGDLLSEAFGAPLEPRVLQAAYGCLGLGNAIRLSQAFHPMPLPLWRPGETEEQRIRQAVDLIPVVTGGLRHCLIQVRDVSEAVRREATLRQQSRQLGEELARVAQAQAQIERQSLRFREITRLAPVGLFETDDAGVLTYANARAEQMLDSSAAAALGHPWGRWVCGDREPANRPVQHWSACAHAGQRFSADIERPGRLGVAQVLRVESTAIVDERGAAIGHIFTLLDVTEFRDRAQRNEYRATHDGLTGLWNREHFENELREALAATADGGSSVPAGHTVILYVDLDRFKPINDRHGHAVGDEVLKAVAQRLRRCVRSSDQVARLGGDEFGVLLRHWADVHQLDRLVQKLRAAGATPITSSVGPLNVGWSVGVAVAGRDGHTLESLLAHADRAMYQIKRLNRTGRDDMPSAGNSPPSNAAAAAAATTPRSHA